MSNGTPDYYEKKITEMQWQFEILETFYEKSGMVFWKKSKLKKLIERNEKIHEQVKKEGRGPTYSPDKASTSLNKEFMGNYNEVERIFLKKGHKIERKYKLNLGNFSRLKNAKDLSEYRNTLAEQVKAAFGKK